MFSSLPFMAFVPANPISGKFQNHSSLIRTLCKPRPQLQLMSNETCYDFSILLCIIDQKNKFKHNSVRSKRHFGFFFIADGLDSPLPQAFQRERILQIHSILNHKPKK